MQEVIDFHGHYFPLSVVAAQPRGQVGNIGSAWPLLTNIDAQLEAASAAGTSLKVVNAPLSSLAPSALHPLKEMPARTNDALAADLQRLNGQFLSLATVDAFTGDAGAEEARRAVEELGFPGIVVDVTSGQQTLADPVARPTLAYAAARGLPVFAHPVTPADLPSRFTGSRVGVLLARGTESALATLALFEQQILTSELKDLKLVVAGIGAAAPLFTTFLASAADGDAYTAQRRRLYIDTMGFDPASIRYLVDAVGADHVLIGSDWPIMWRDASAERVSATLAAAGLSAEEAAQVSQNNARGLLAPAAQPAG